MPRSRSIRTSAADRTPAKPPGTELLARIVGAGQCGTLRPLHSAIIGRDETAWQKERPILDLGVPNEAILRIAADLADRYNANVIGIAACQPLLDVYGSGYLPPEIYKDDQKRIDRDLEAAEQVAPAEDLDAIRKVLQDVVAWLEGHGVTANYEALSSDDSDSHGLEAFATAEHAGLMVTGAYGHNRVREWVLGGVTRDLLTHPSRCSLLSH